LLLLIVLAVMLGIGQILAKGFLSPLHVGSILRTASFLGIAAVGQTLLILSGGIDVSVGAVITAGNVLACMFINGSNPATAWAVPAVLLCGAVAGLFNGILIAYIEIHSLIMTLITASLVQGLVLIYSKGAPKGLSSPILQVISTSNVFGVPIVVLIWFFIAVMTIFVLKRTTFGRRIYYIGSNLRAAMLSGIRTRLVTTVCYVISGVFAAMTGVLMAGYTRTAFLGIGTEYTLWTVAAVVVGGTALTGGRGSYLGTFLGAIVLVVLESILTILQMPEAGRYVGRGLVIVVMVGAYYLRSPESIEQ
jgi:ribose transport system permease protein